MASNNRRDELPGKDIPIDRVKGITKDGKDWDIMVPKHGAWTEVVDFSDRDYSSSFGYILFMDGKEVERMETGGRLGKAYESAKEAKTNFLAKLRRERQVTSWQKNQN